MLGLQEAVVVGMADGYAQATRNAAFVNLHSAAGVGHAMGNIFTAYRNRTPLVITAGQQARSILPYDPFLYSAQATELPKPYVKWSCEPARAEDVPLAIARAYYIAMQPPRGPVLVSDSGRRLGEALRARRGAHGEHASSGPSRACWTRSARRSTTSTRPAFVVGAAVDRDGAWDDVVRLAERHHAAVWVAPMSGRCSFPEDHALFAGFLPPMREKIVDLLAAHDVDLRARRRRVHLPRRRLRAASSRGRAAGPADRRSATSPRGRRRARPPWAASASACWTSSRATAAAPRERPGAAPRAAARRAVGADVRSRYVMQTLAEIRDPASIVVEEAPSSRRAMQTHLPIMRSETFYTMDSGGLGWGMPAAVGVALGKPGAKVIALIGDGSSMYSIQALWSAAQLALPITFIVLKNRRYAALPEFAPAFGFAPDEPLPGTELPGIDFVALARGQGCDGVEREPRRGVARRAGRCAAGERSDARGSGYRLNELAPHDSRP